MIYLFVLLILTGCASPNYATKADIFDMIELHEARTIGHTHGDDYVHDMHDPKGHTHEGLMDEYQIEVMDSLMK